MFSSTEDLCILAKPSISFLFLLERFLPAVLLLHSPDLPPLASALNISKSTTENLESRIDVSTKNGKIGRGKHVVNIACKKSNVLFRDAVSYLLMNFFRISRSLLKRKSPSPPLGEEIENNLRRRVYFSLGAFNRKKILGNSIDPGSIRSKLGLFLKGMKIRARRKNW